MLYNLFERLYKLLIKDICREVEPTAGDRMSDKTD